MANGGAATTYHYPDQPDEPRSNGEPTRQKHSPRYRRPQMVAHGGPLPEPSPALYNRIAAVIEHIPWYCFRTQVRLAQDSHISEAAISRLLRGECQPSLLVALQVTHAIEQRLGHHLDLRELFSLDGQFPTPFPCQVTGCPNCLPQFFYDEGDGLKRECQDIKPGRWSLVQAHHIVATNRPTPLMLLLGRKEAV